MRAVLSSPFYPGFYDNNAHCLWRVTVPLRHFIALEFEYFDLEDHPACGNDYLEIRDGPSLRSPLIGRFCGSRYPPVLESSGTDLLMTFVTNDRVSRTGFTAQYSARPGINCISS